MPGTSIQHQHVHAMKTRHSTNLAAVMATVTLLLSAVVACSDSNQTVGQKVDAAVASSERKADQIKADIKRGAADVKETASQATASAMQMAKDATLTSSVKLALAKDASLSALKIDVETHDGRVALNGVAPDAAAKARATTLAHAVTGVTSVDNRLTLR